MEGSQEQQTRRSNPATAYVKGALEEVRKVTWPSRQETWRKSWIVIWLSVAFALFLGAMDFLLNRVLEVLL